MNMFCLLIDILVKKLLLRSNAKISMCVLVLRCDMLRLQFCDGSTTVMSVAAMTSATDSGRYCITSQISDP